MSFNSALLFAMLVVTALSPIAIILAVLRYLHSRSRNELWTLRDMLVDDLIAGRIQRTAASHRLLELVETHIRAVGKHTLVDLLVVFAIYRGKDIRSVDSEILGGNAPAVDRPLLDDYLRRLWGISFRYLISSSPTGWVSAAGFWVGRRTWSAFADRGQTSERRPLSHVRIAEEQRLQKAKQLELKMPDLMANKPSRQYAGVGSGRA